MTFGIDPSTWHAAVQVFFRASDPACVSPVFARLAAAYDFPQIAQREGERERGCWSVVMNSVGNMDEGKNGEQRETNERKVR